MRAGSILVLGARGQVGSVVVRELAAKGTSVLAATRYPSSLQVPTNVRTIAFNYHDPATFLPALEDVDRVYMMAPPGFADAEALLAPWLNVATKHVKHVVTMTASGVDANDRIPLRKVERLVEGSGVAYTHLRPTWFMQNFHTMWWESIRATGKIYVPAAYAKTAFIDARDIGACVATVLTDPGHAGKAYRLTGPDSVTYKEAADVLSKETGREIGYQPIDDLSFRRALLETGFAPDYASMMVSLFGSVREGLSAAVSPDVEIILRRRPRSLAEYARDMKRSFVGW